jgi:hypothetical protein
LACHSQTQHTNARSQVTATTYQAFDEPSYDAPLQITGPGEHLPAPTRATPTASQSTLTRSGTWFNPNSGDQRVRQSVAQRTFVYDGYQRLCKTIEPDAGITVIDYDAGRQSGSGSAGGQNTLTSTIDCQRTSVPDDGSLDSIAYDALVTACSASITPRAPY